MADNHYASQTYDSDDEIANCNPIPVGPHEAGTFIAPASMTTQKIWFYASDTETGTYNLLGSTGTTKIEIVAANQAHAYPIPSGALDGVKWLKIVTETDAVAGIRLTFN